MGRSWAISSGINSHSSDDYGCGQGQLKTAVALWLEFLRSIHPCHWPPRLSLGVRLCKLSPKAYPYISSLWAQCATLAVMPYLCRRRARTPMNCQLHSHAIFFQFSILEYLWLIQGVQAASALLRLSLSVDWHGDKIRPVLISKIILFLMLCTPDILTYKALNICVFLLERHLQNYLLLFGLLRVVRQESNIWWQECAHLFWMFRNYA